MSNPDFDLHSSVAPVETTTEKHTSLLLILSAIGIALAIALLVGNITISVYQDHQNDLEIETLARTNERTLREHNATINLLCDRGYIIDGIILATIDLIKTGRPPSAADRSFINRLDVYHLQILGQLTDEESPCVRG